jgi:hypothetical protein
VVIWLRFEQSNSWIQTWRSVVWGVRSSRRRRVGEANSRQQQQQAASDTPNCMALQSRKPRQLQTRLVRSLLLPNVCLEMWRASCFSESVYWTNRRWYVSLWSIVVQCNWHLYRNMATILSGRSNYWSSCRRCQKKKYFLHAEGELCNRYQSSGKHFEMRISLFSELSRKRKLLVGETANIQSLVFSNDQS